MELRNRKALHEYEILERYVAGLVLMGPEVKALRSGAAQLEEAFGAFRGGELFLYNLHIAPYAQRGYALVESRRPRKLLLRREELRRLLGKLTQKGLTLIPLRIFFNERGYAKVELGLARGKRLYDRREAIKAREARRDLERLVKGRQTP